jgi:hypothetical protein
MYVFLVRYHAPLKNKKTQYACNAHITKKKYPKKNSSAFGSASSTWLVHNVWHMLAKGKKLISKLRQQFWVSERFAVSGHPGSCDARAK